MDGPPTIVRPDAALILIADDDPASRDLLEMALETMSTQQRRRHFEKMQRAIRHFAQLLDDVLSFGQADADRLEFNPERRLP